MNIITQIDNYITNVLVAKSQNEKLKRILAMATHLGDAIFHIPLFTVFYICGGAALREFVIKSVVATLIGVIILYAIRMNVKRPRPIGDMPKEFVIIPLIEKYSFPSGHAMRNFIFPVTAWPLLGATLSVPLAVVAAIITSARICLRLHYFSDIIAGAALGISAAFITMHIL
ncbi:MAG TPA: phosphatase PAP2 family protein [Candidatus Wallbacteria bacterium]|nr:phosphatase PAP2 family protein [Candidatus Wallbacteria bacterium]